MHNNPAKDVDYNAMIARLSSMTSQEFLKLGTDGLSYIRPISLRGEPSLYTLYGADGSHIATGQDLPTLEVIARQSNLISLSIQ